MSLSEMSSGTAADSQGPPSPHLLQARLDDAMLMGKLVLFLREWEFGFRAQMPGCVLASFLSLSLDLFHLSPASHAHEHSTCAVASFLFAQPNC